MPNTISYAAMTAAFVMAGPAGALADDGAKVEQTQAQAQAQDQAKNGRQLDGVIVIGGNREGRAIDTLQAASVISLDDMNRMGASTTSQLFASTPGISASGAGDDKSSVVNVRGLQDNGRVQVLVDGARQDFSRPTHAGYGSFYLDPDILRSVAVLRGPSATGGGGIGGVISFETLAPSDILGQDRWAVRQKLGYETNGDVKLVSSTGAIRLSDKIALLANAVYRDNGAYEDGTGAPIRLSAEAPFSGLLKAVLDPTEHNQITLSATTYNDTYRASRMAGSPSATLSVDRTNAQNNAVTGRWTYRPDSAFIDFVANAYRNQTDVDQIKVGGAAPLGTQRGYTVTTSGVNAFNALRFDAGGLHNIVTLGADYAHSEAAAYGDTSAAVGKSENGGAFVQWEGSYASWLQLVGSVRYNTYELTGLDRSVTPNVVAHPKDDGVTSRLSVGVTPIKGFTAYATYAEGFRAPALYEVFGVYAGGAVTNPSLQLKPEEAKSWEYGVNYKHDGLLAETDSVRLKLNYFDTDITGFITGRNLAGNTRYYNLRDAKLRGWEFEGGYDASWGFFSFGGSQIDAFREGAPISGTTATAPTIPIDGIPLSTAPLNRVSATVGLNLWDGRASFGGGFSHISETERRTLSFLTYPPAPAYELINLFGSVALNDKVVLRANIDNLANRNYTDPQAQYAVASATSFQGRGRTLKLTVIARLGGR